VPVVLWTYIFQGIYFNLSFWYKLTDKTQWGAWFSLIGLVITFALQVLLVPKYGYMASAASSLVCYFVIMLLSYFVGKRHLVIPYDFKRIAIATGICLLILAGYYASSGMGTWTRMAVGTGLIVVYMVGVWLTNRTTSRAH
jgi:O-antigen/teichoic acid export membrane protein